MIEACILAGIWKFIGKIQKNDKTFIYLVHPLTIVQWLGGIYLTIN